MTDVSSTPSSRALLGTTALLVLVNLVPIAGVLFWDWSVYAIALLFWAENVIVGAFNVARFWVLWRFRNDSQMVIAIPFFCLHFGIFTAVHLGLVIGLLAPEGGPVLPLDLIAIPFLALLISHGVSFYTHFIGQGDYKQAEPRELMVQPYMRLLAMQAFVIVGGMTVAWIGSPMAALMVLVLAKMAIDVVSHRREHQRKLARELHEAAPPGHDPDFPRWEASEAEDFNEQSATDLDPQSLLAVAELDLEKIRQQHAHLRRQALRDVGLIAAVALLVAMLLAWLTDLPFPLGLFAAGMLTVFAVASRIERIRKQWRRFVVSAVLPRVCGGIGGLQVVGYLNRRLLGPFEKLGLVSDHWNRSSFGPRLRGRRLNGDFEFGPVTLTHRSGGKNSSTEVVFKGLLLRIRLPGDVAERVVISGQSLLAGRRHMVQVSTADAAFDKLFSVHVAQDAEDPEKLATTLLDERWRAALLSLLSIEGGQEGEQLQFQAAFYQDSLYLTLARRGRRKTGPAGIVMESPGREFFQFPLALFRQPRLEQSILELIEDACVGPQVVDRLPIGNQGQGLGCIA